jgi:hypothetical protein
MLLMALITFPMLWIQKMKSMWRLLVTEGAEGPMINSLPLLHLPSDKLQLLPLPSDKPHPLHLPSDDLHRLPLDELQPLYLPKVSALLHLLRRSKSD